MPITDSIQESMKRSQAQPGGGGDMVTSTQPAPMNVIEDSYQRTREFLAGGGVQEPAVDYNRQYDQLIGASASVAGALMRGQIPLDVQRSVRQAAAETGRSRGLGEGSPASRFLVARDLGLTSLSLMEKGLSTAKDVSELAQRQRESLLSYLTDLRKLDLTGTEMKEQSRKTNLEARIQLQQNLITAMSNYHSIAATYATSDETEEGDTDALAQDYGNLIKSIRSSLGGPSTPQKRS
jgi:hypothetical protein